MNQKQKLFFFSVSGSDNTANFSWLKVSLDPFPTSKLFRARVKNVVFRQGSQEQTAHGSLCMLQISLRVAAQRMPKTRFQDVLQIFPLNDRN